MIPALGFMVAAYTITRLLNTTVLDQEQYREVRGILAVIAIVIIAWAAWRIGDLASGVNLP